MLVYLTDEFAAKLDQYHIEDRFEILRARIEGMNGQIALKALFKPYPAQQGVRLDDVFEGGGDDPVLTRRFCRHTI